MMEKGWGFTDHGTLKLGVFHKWFDKLSRLIEWYLYTGSDGYPLKLPKFAVLGCHCLAYKLSANQIVRCFKLKILKTIWGIKFIFPSIEATKNILFWVMPENTLGQSVCRIVYFWLVNPNTGGPLPHCTCYYCQEMVKMFQMYHLRWTNSHQFLKMKNP